MGHFSVVALVLLVATLCNIAHSYSIAEFGAITNNGTYEAAVANGKALYQAAQAANASTVDSDKTVVVPNGMGIFTMLPYRRMERLFNITFHIDGTLQAYRGPTPLWPNTTDGSVLHFIDIANSNHITIAGSGLLDGQGYDWWWFVLLTGVDHRPYLLNMYACMNTYISGITLHNAPMYHVYLSQMVDVLVVHVTVWVDVYKQKAMLDARGLLDRTVNSKGLPVFPLNTDGIDIAGKNVIVRSCNITNFDDALCVKPSDSRGPLIPCTENMLWEHNTIHYSVGCSVGSVPPHQDVNCIRNVTMRNNYMYQPIKGIYVKPDPPLSPDQVNGTGIMDTIIYENMVIEEAMMWSIFVSTQQQAQPGNGTKTGCSFFYPLPGTKCPTVPQVPVTNLKLRNITSKNAWLSPGILRCDPRGPCTGWDFEHVTIESRSNWPIGDHFLCGGLMEPKFTNVNVNCTTRR